MLNNSKKMGAVLARFFSPTIIRALINDSDSTKSLLNEVYLTMKEQKRKFHGDTYNDFFKFAYKHLIQNYRNEYVYKNLITKKLLLDQLSLDDSFMLQEFRVGICKADIVILNGTSIVYEIKSELDSLERLTNQVETYLKVFDKVNVVTFLNESKKIKDFIPKNVGIIELDKKNNIKIIRQPKSGKKNISLELLFDSLRKKEYENIIKKHYNYILDVPNTESYFAYKKLFIEIKPEIAHNLSIEELKKRGNNKELIKFIKKAPDYFKSLSFQCNFSKDEINKFMDKLKSKLNFI